MFCMTLIIGIVHTLLRLTVNADRTAGMLQRTYISVITPLGKALTAGAVAVARMTASHHDIALAAIIFLIVTTILHATF
jgi:ABC-type transport system involved in cytochrome bd biosynthesis fused ATPase/permease subunit